MDEMNGYNGAYTGAQIDAAIGAVRNKETTWDGKQDKLTGLQGQYVGFDGDGDAIAQNAPSSLPEGGTAGQMLYKTDDGVAWGDKPVMYVNITESEGAYSSDKTATEILQAVSEGYAVFAIFQQNSVFPLINTIAFIPRVIFGVFRLNGTTLTCVAVAISGGGNVNVTSQIVGADVIAFTSTSSIISDTVQDAIEEVQSHIPTDVATPADVEAAKPFKVAITIPTSGWSDNQQTFTVTGIPSNPQNHEVRLATVGTINTQALEDAGLRIADEAANSLTLKVSTVPTASFQVYAVITPLQ